MDHFGSRLKITRKTEGLNQDQASDLFGIAYGTYLNIEHGKGTSWENVNKIITNLRFEKYLVYLTTGKTYEKNEQVTPKTKDEYKPINSFASRSINTFTQDDVERLKLFAKSLPDISEN